MARSTPSRPSWSVAARARLSCSRKRSSRWRWTTPSRLIRDHGFDVPQTLLTTSPAEVLRFAERVGPLIYKWVSGTRSIIARLDLADAHLSQLRCPTRFQERIGGRDYRVHVVGERAFACAIESSADDHRHASGTNASLAMEHVTLEDVDVARCVELTRQLGLQLSGIDFRRTPEGRWVSFEVNTDPAFAYFDDDRGSIAAAVAELLEGTAGPARASELR